MADSLRAVSEIQMLSSFVKFFLVLSYVFLSREK